MRIRPRFTANRLPARTRGLPLARARDCRAKPTRLFLTVLRARHYLLLSYCTTFRVNLKRPVNTVIQGAKCRASYGGAYEAQAPEVNGLRNRAGIFSTSSIFGPNKFDSTWETFFSLTLRTTEAERYVISTGRRCSASPDARYANRYGNTYGLLVPPHLPMLPRSSVCGNSLRTITAILSNS